MGMHPTTVRFSDSLWQLIETEAQRDGVSASQYIRESVLARIMVAEAVRGGARDWERAVREIRRLLEPEEG